MKTVHKKSLASAAFALILFAGLAGFIPKAYAQTTSTTAFVSCTALSHNLRYGESDIDIMTLQNFLAQQRYFAHVATGYFGPITFQSVIAFQAHYGIEQTGFVGPITRGEIQTLTCNAPIPTPTPLPVSITNINPDSATVGTTVTITGQGFTNDNTIFFAGGAISNIPSSSGTTINFTIPSAIGPYCPPGTACPMYVRLITSGTYSLYVTNSNGTSNTESITITGTNGLVSPY